MTAPDDAPRGAPEAGGPTPTPPHPGAPVTGPEELDRLRFNDAGLLPVVTQDARTGAVLMVAWANRDALERTLETGFLHYFSRSRNTLWKKGETSGNVQRVVTLQADCDGDTLLARVTMAGPACHTGAETCFGPPLVESLGETLGKASVETRGQTTDETPDRTLARLWSVLEARSRERPEGSYTTRLLDDENLRLKKLGEEAVELVTALLRRDGRAPEEAADLLYHLLVALLAGGHSLEEVTAELARRFPGGSGTPGIPGGSDAAAPPTPSPGD